MICLVCAEEPDYSQKYSDSYETKAWPFEFTPGKLDKTRRHVYDDEVCLIIYCKNIFVVFI